MDMINKVKDYIKEYDMIKPGDTVVIGVSGGPDSVCLLLMLDEIFKDSIELKVVHINHGLREAAEDEAVFVRGLCKKMNRECIVKNANVKEIAEKKGISVEEAGREVRYSAFKEALGTSKGRIAVAHNMNDNAETYLFNGFRGSSYNGLCGIKPVNGSIVRPLLCIERSEILEYLNRNNINYCTDESNATDEYTRNIIRHHILPKAVECINRRAVENIFSLTEEIEEVSEYIGEEADKVKKQLVMFNERSALIDRRLSEYRSLIIKAVVYDTFVEISGHMKDVEKKHIKSIIELFDKQVGKRISLPYDITAEVTYEGVELKKNDEADAHESCRVKELSSDDCFGGFRIKQRRFKYESFMQIPKDKYTKWADCDKIEKMLYAGYRKDGDYITLDKSGTTKKLSRLFIDSKVPQKERDKTVIISDAEKVVWVVGYRLSYDVMIDENTKEVLEISVIPE